MLLQQASSFRRLPLACAALAGRKLARAHALCSSRCAQPSSQRLSRRHSSRGTLSAAVSSTGPGGGTQTARSLRCASARHRNSERCTRLQLKCEWNLSSSAESWVASAVFLGMMLGSYTWGSLSDAYGRKVGFFAPACFTAVFGVVSAFSPNFVVRRPALNAPPPSPLCRLRKLSRARPCDSSAVRRSRC